MTPSQRAALNLADTLLADEATPEVMLVGSIQAFGAHWRWMPGLCTHLLHQTAGSFHCFHREEIANLIHAYPDYVRAWNDPDHTPKIARFALAPPILPPRPDWVPQHLPRWRSPRDLSEWFGVPLATLNWLCGTWRQDAQTPSCLDHYGYRWVNKRSGGVRLIEIPKSRLRESQRTVLRGLLAYLPVHPAAHGFLKGRSCLSHADLHTNQAMVIRLDLEDFFSSVPASRIHALFSHLGYPDSVARLLTGLCTHHTPWRELNIPTNRARIPFRQRQRLNCAHLPQGAPTSPALANLCAFRLDMRLDGLARSMQATYSRYADDLVFSGGQQFAARARNLSIHIAAIAMEEGFSLNMRKTRFLRAGARQQITGLVVNEFPNIPRPEYDRLKAVLHNCVVHGADTQNREGKPDFRAHLLGKISYVMAVNPAKGVRLKHLFSQIDWGATHSPGV